MVRYRRNKLKGGTYFFTVTLRNRKLKLLTEYIHLLSQSIRRVRNENPFKTIAIVVLPDHLHTIWELPLSDDDYSMRWKKIKTYFTKEILKAGINLDRNRHNEYKLWQRRFWEHTIKNESNLNRHVDYIHYNPVKHNYVNTVIEWPYSSFHLYVKKKILPCDWAFVSEDKPTETCVFGEI